MRRFSYRFLALLVSSATALMLVGCPGFFTPRSSSGGSGSTPKFAFVANCLCPSLGTSPATGGSISVFTINATTGALTGAGNFTTGSSTISNGPIALITVAGKFLYSANDGGSVSGFTVNASTGTLTAIAGSPYPAGSNPNALIADSTGKFLYVANSFSNDISAFSIDGTTGALAPIGTFVAGSSSATAGQAFGLAMDSASKFLYVAEDRTGIVVFSRNANTGALTFVQSIAPPAGGAPQSIAIIKSGNFLYAADSVSGVEEYSVNPSSGNLTLLTSTPVPAGSAPAFLVADANGTHIYVANQQSNDVFSYGVLSDGTLASLSGGQIAAGSLPISLGIDPSGKFVYVTNFNGSPDVSVYTIDSSGKLVNSNSASTGVALANAASIAFL